MIAYLIPFGQHILDILKTLNSFQHILQKSALYSIKSWKVLSNMY